LVPDTDQQPRAFIVAEFEKNVTMHTSLQHDVVTTTTDKLRLRLAEFERNSARLRDWVTPAGITLTFAASLATSNFKDFLGVAGTEWHAIFIILLFFSMLWLVSAIVKALALLWRIGKSNLVDQTIDKIISQQSVRKSE